MEHASLCAKKGSKFFRSGQSRKSASARGATVNANSRPAVITPANAPKSERTNFVFRSARELVAEPTPTQWLVKNLFELATFALFYGDAGSCKTWVALSIAVHVAAGAAWFGNEVASGAVFVVAGEGNRGLRRRLAGFIKHHEFDVGMPLFVSEGAAAFTENESVADVITSVQRLVVETEQRPVLVIVDTLARNFGAADENSSKDMGAFVKGCDWVRNEFGCTVLVLHHVGHADKTRARGSTTLRGALDVEYRISRDDAGTVDLTCTKAKDIEAPASRRFVLNGIELDWKGDEGFPICSPVLVATDAEPVARGKAGRGKNQTKALRILEEAYDRQRSNLIRSGLDPVGALVPLQSWRDLCREDGISRSRMYEVEASLRNTGHIKIDGAHVLFSECYLDRAN